MHTPIQAQAGLKTKYEAKAAALYGAEPAAVGTEPGATTKTRQDNPAYAAMVESVDRSVARVRETLERLGLAKNTIIMFVSDNGGLSTLAGTRGNAPTSNLPLRAGKGWLYEGGIRVPAIISGPGVKAGAIVETPAVTTDVYPTLLALAGLDLRPAQHRDGVNLRPLLTGSGSDRIETRSSSTSRITTAPATGRPAPCAKEAGSSSSGWRTGASNSTTSPGIQARPATWPRTNPRWLPA